MRGDIGWSRDGCLSGFSGLLIFVKSLFKGADMQLRTALFSVALFVSVSAGAQNAPVIQFVWMGGNDCPPCVSWRKDQLPLLQNSKEFAGVTFSYVTKSIRSPVPSSMFLPTDVKPFKDKLDYASSGRAGSPQAALIVNGEVFDYFHKSRSAAEIEAMLVAVKTGTPYPFERCVKASNQWGKCEVVGQ